jgi:hypothetical protein
MRDRKAIELSLTECVVKVRGGKAHPEQDRWPDSWIEDRGERIPIEVVTGYPRPPGEKPKHGAVAAKAEKDANVEAERLLREGAGAVMGGVLDANRPFAVPVGSDAPLPIPLRSQNPVAWILAAIDQKLTKHYSEASRTILIVDFHNGMPLYAFELTELAAQLAARSCPFREVWVCPEVSANVAQYVFPTAPAA